MAFGFDASRSRHPKQETLFLLEDLCLLFFDELFAILLGMNTILYHLSWWTLQGYDEIDTLERPLVSAVDGGDYDGENNGGEREQEPGVVRNVAQQQAVFVPSQHEELEMLTVL